MSYYREALLIESANAAVQDAVKRIKATTTVNTKST
jgi:hypothetical protein|tara:strand:+ start:165 stop:272 length:108 start_codon:yes stop_codon:yes gene_type:complete